MNPSIEKTLRHKLEIVNEEFRAYTDVHNVIFNKAPFEALLFIMHNRLDDVSRHESQTYLDTLNSLLPWIDNPTQEQKRQVFRNFYRLGGWLEAIEFVFEEAICVEQIEIRLMSFEESLRRDTPAMKPTTSVFSAYTGNVEGMRYCLSIMNAE
jgi:hypothetical protein